MKTRRFSHIKGFTLIELIIVIAIIAILSSFVVIAFTSLTQKAKIATDEASLVILNTATISYEKMEGISTADVFSGITTDTGRMQRLITFGYLREAVVPEQSGAQFVWDIPNQEWILSGGTNSVSSSAAGSLSNSTASSMTSSSSSSTANSLSSSISSSAVSSVSSSSASSSQVKVIAVAEVFLDRTSLVLTAAMKQVTLVVRIDPQNATNQSVTWTSSNTKYVTVDKNGVVKFVKAGEAVITVTTVDGKKKATCEVITK